MKPRETIVDAFAKWTALSATRSGCPIKSRKDVYPLIELPNYNRLFRGKHISQKDFDKWHKKNTLKIHEKSKKLPVGWAAKLINVYLKTMVYLAGEGRPGLIQCIHPPIDNGLWAGIKKEYKNDNKDDEIKKQLHVFTGINKIKTYADYVKIIDLCRTIAKNRKCKLIEVEELWQVSKETKRKMSKYG